MMNKDIDLANLTELQAVEKSIRMWEFLSGDGRREKDDFFCSESNLYHRPLSGCYLCEYYIRIKAQKLERRKWTNADDTPRICRETGCPLAEPSLCHFGRYGSAFDRWMSNSIETQDERQLRRREDDAYIILEAIRKYYKKMQEDK